MTGRFEMETRGRYGKGYERWMYHDVSMCHSLSVVFEGNHLVLRQWGSVIHPLKSALPLETLPEWNTPKISRTTPASGNMSAVRANLSMENQWNKSDEGQPWCDWWPTKCFDAYDVLFFQALTSAESWAQLFWHVLTVSFENIYIYIWCLDWISGITERYVTRSFP